MDRCWKCGNPMTKNSRELKCSYCGRTVQRHKNKSNSNYRSGQSTSDSSIEDSLSDLLAAYIAIDNAEKREQARIRSEKRREWIKRHIKGIAITVSIIITAILLFIGYHEVQLLTPIGYDSASLEGIKYPEVVQLLKESGFTNIRTQEVSDLTISREDEANMVTDVKLLYTDKFDKDTKYPSNLWITVVYHTVELYNPPLSSKKAKGMNYKDVISEFENVGFTNITVNIEYDIITGWFADDGEVKSVTINGKDDYDSYDEYRLDTEIIITYHTLRSNKPE